MKTKLVLVAIIILASALRLYQLGHVPLGLFGDEIDAGYNAYSLLKTARDYNGNFLPVHSESMGDYRPVGFFYSLIPSIGLLGLSDFSVRLMPALYGIFSVYLVYLIVERLAGNSYFELAKLRIKLSYVAAFVLAITPWHIHFSRVALDVGLTTTLLLLGTYLFLKVFDSKQKFSFYWLITSVLIFGLNSYSYQVAKLYSPLLLGINLWIFRKNLLKLSKYYLLISVALFLLILYPLVHDTLYGSGQSRFNSLSIFNTIKVVEEINHSRGQIVNAPEPIKKMFHNKAISIGYLFVNNYLSSFSPNFLFASGDVNNPRHSVPGFGLFYWWMFPFFIFGLLKTGNSLIDGNNKYNHFSFLTLLWLATSPVPSSLTQEGGQHAIRLFVMLPPIIFLVAIGIIEAFFLLRAIKFKLLVFTSFWLPVILSSIFFVQRYFVHYSYNNFQNWQYGLKPAINFVEENKQNFEQVFITKSFVHLPMLYYVFYTSYDPEVLQRKFIEAKNGTAPPPTDQIDNIKFITINPGDIFAPQNTLYVASPYDRSVGWELVKQIMSPDPTDTKPVLVIQKT